MIHTLKGPPAVHPRHRLVRAVTTADLADLVVEPEKMIPEPRITRAAAGAGRMFGAVAEGKLVGHGSSFAASHAFADVGVHVADPYRRQGVATAAAAMACAAVQRAGLTPVWGTGSTNAASLATAARLGFVEVDRLVYLVPQRGQLS